MAWFNFEKYTVETLIHKWDSRSKCVIVSCDEEDQPAQTTINEEEDATFSKEEVTAEAEQLATTSATLLHIKKSSSHLKPSTKVCGCPNILQSISYQNLRRNIVQTLGTDK